MAGELKHGFVQLDNDLFLRAAELGLRPVDVVVVGVVEARRNGKNGKSFASFATIGASIGRTGDAVKQSVRRMRELGLLEVTRRHDEGGHARGYEYDFRPLFDRLRGDAQEGGDALQRGDALEGVAALEGDSNLEGANAPQGETALQGVGADPTRASTPPEQYEENNTAATARANGRPGDSELPDDLPSSLRETVEAVWPIIERIAAAKDAIAPSRRGLANVIARSSGADHLDAAHDIEQWLLHGTGRGKQVRDVVQTYRNTLSRQANGRPNGHKPSARASSRTGVDYDQVVKDA